MGTNFHELPGGLCPPDPPNTGGLRPPDPPKVGLGPRASRGHTIMGQYGILWNSIVFYGTLWYSMVFYGIPWYSMVFHGIP